MFRTTVVLVVIAAATAGSLDRSSAAGIELYGRVSSSSITLTSASGEKVSTLRAGAYVIVVRDRSAREDFHLISLPIVDKKTGRAFVGTVKWSVSLTAGAYRYRSDAHASSLHGVFRVR
jgi:hypothetical protein